jgi:phenylacetate-CoA ligase
LHKQDFIQKYSTAERSNANENNTDFIYTRTGSTGNPTFWYRNIKDEQGVNSRFVQIFDKFKVKERSTLCVVVFPLGTWVGGMFTTFCTSCLSLKGYKITLLTPGNKPNRDHQILQRSNWEI